MKKAITGFIVCSLAFMLVALPALNAVACAPIVPFAIVVNPNHPDFPLHLLAEGNLGIIQPSWAMSYLCVCYRYLSNYPLTKVEQQTILRLWHNRLRDMERVGFRSLDTDHSVASYLKLRNKALGSNERTVPDLWDAKDDYGNVVNIQNDAFDLAYRTLAARIKAYGLHSSPVREWLSGQDRVFGTGWARKISIPPPLALGFDRSMLADREYQIAAATFYSLSFAEARKLFEKISEDKKSPWSKIASYMVVRSAVADDHESVSQKISLVQSALSKESDFRRRQDLIDLLGMAINKDKSSPEIIDRTSKSIMTTHSDQFGHDVGDLTYSMGMLDQAVSDQALSDQGQVGRDRQVQTAGGVKSEGQKSDLVDWLDTMQWGYEDYLNPDYLVDDIASLPDYEQDSAKHIKARIEAKATHTIEQWRKTHSTAWLVALMSWNGLRSPKLEDALDAARKIPPSSPAYLTASFFIVDALINAGKASEARARIKLILARADLPPSSRNLFQTQLVAVASNVDEYLSAAVFKVPVVTEADTLLPSDWDKLESGRSFSTCGSAVDESEATDINHHLPLSMWLKLAQERNHSSDFRGRIVAATWLRAQLLNKPDVAAKLSNQLVAAYPFCSSLMKSYQTASSAEEKEFALARLILRNYGMSPYLYAGVAREGQRFDEHNMYRINFWLPLPPRSVQTKSKEEAESKCLGGVSNYGTYVTRKLMKDYKKLGVQRVLSKQQIADAHSEQSSIYKNHPSKFLGEPVLAWAKSHPDDPDVPEMLYRVLKLPWWSGESEIGSKYLRPAFKLLKSKYPHSKWAAKAVCSY